MHIGNEGTLAITSGTAVRAEGDHLVGAPVGKPEPSVVPPR